VIRCPLDLCDGYGRVPLHWSEGYDGRAYVDYGPCPCADMVSAVARPQRVKEDSRAVLAEKKPVSK
jgi:hypothetical protein